MTRLSCLWSFVFRLFLLHNRSSSSTKVMRTTTRATCLAITREGGGEERKREKGSQGIGRNEICPGKGREREGKRRSEQAALSVGTSQSVQPAMERRAIFPCLRTMNGIAITTAQEPDGRERACNHLKGPPKRWQRGDQRRPKEMHRLHQISARAPSSHTVDGRVRCDWPAGPMLPFTMGPILRESWSPLSLALLIIELNLDIR